MLVVKLHSKNCGKISSYPVSSVYRRRNKQQKMQQKNGIREYSSFEVYEFCEVVRHVCGFSKLIVLIIRQF
jgi:hypothetical protein